MNLYLKKFFYNFFYVFRHGYSTRITVLGLRLRIKHKTYRYPTHYGYKRILSNEEGNNLLREFILSGKPFALGRMGVSELSIVFGYYRQQYKKNIFLNKDHIAIMKNNAGFFSADNSSLIDYSQQLLDFLKNFDMLVPWMFHFHHEEMIYRYFSSKKCRYVNFSCIGYGNIINNNSWLQALKGRKVLIIHPFKKTIETQLQKRSSSDNSPVFLPDCEIKVLKAVQGIDTENAIKEYGTWFNALQYMYDEIDKVDYDTAIIGAGAFGMFLANHIKLKGKQAIQLCGTTQLLFGIKGARWDSANIYTDQWINVLSEEVPQNLDKFLVGEGSKAYW